MITTKKIFDLGIIAFGSWSAFNAWLEKPHGDGMKIKDLQNSAEGRATIINMLTLKIYKKPDLVINVDTFALGILSCDNSN